MRAVILAGLLALLPTAAAAQPAASNWVVARTPQGATYTHSVAGAGGVGQVNFICADIGAPVLTVALPNQRPGTHLSLILTGPGEATAAVDTGWRHHAGSTAFSALLTDGQLLDLVAGPAPFLAVSLNGQSSGRLSLAGAREALTAALAACWQPPRTTPAAPGEAGFTIDLALSARASAELARRGEGITASIMYSGEPRPAYASRGDETTGEIDLGEELVTVPGRAGAITVTGQRLRRERLPWLRGAPQVLVNIFSARQRGPDNLLDCGIISGPLNQVAGRRHRILCQMIGERR